MFASGGRRVKHVTIDIDSFPIEVHGKQHGASYNGYYKKSVYHPLVASLSVHGDYDRCATRTDRVVLQRQRILRNYCVIILVLGNDKDLINPI
ncbi:hypothetical protein K227x_22820 [Rubripirellula lacrimiformis]|uniref:Transposase DDE domain-containing protein n=1 Tax=Rubripirellula lacrimiformis TaxID=1930273 RepID=A0A517N9T1_9BACT|nr:hypothetical protein K227x_22820 [Rubripirellula lacrimiformis]